MARTIAITYGTYIVGLSGTDANVRPTGKYRMDEDYATFSMTFDVIVLGASASAFATSEASLIAAFRKPHQDLTVVLGGETRHSFSHSSNTGMNAQPEINKVGGSADTDRSAKYRITVSLQLPADLSGRNGRLSSSVDVNTLPNKARMVTISGTYTALSSNSARTQYEAQIDTYAAAVKTDLSVTTWEIAGTPKADADDQDKVLTFSRTYREVIYNQGVGTADVASIVDPRLLIRRVEPAANDTDLLGAVEPLRTYVANYVATIDWTVTTDTDSLYTTTIRPHILAEIEALAGGAVYVVREAQRFDLDKNRIYADWEVLTDAGYDLLSATRVTEDIRSSGEIRYPVWNGDVYAADVYQGHKSWIRRVRQAVYRVVGSGGPIDVATPPGFRPNNDVHKYERRKVGNYGGAQLDTEIVVASQEFARVNDAALGRGGGGAGPTQPGFGIQ